MNKGVIFFLYVIALYFSLRNYYQKQSGSGIPDPRVIGAPTYLYAILGVVADFTGGLTIPLALGLTVALAWAQEKQVNTPATNKAPPGPVGPLSPPPVSTKSSAKTAYNQR